jgi:pleiotropic regulator 1
MKLKEKQFNEEVTKHSVHTLVFRSLKRTHDMFVSDRNELPPGDSEADQVMSGIKSRAMYGKIRDDVDRLKNMPDYQKQGQENGSETGENGAVSVYKPPNMMAAAVKNNQGTVATSGVVGEKLNQLAVRKAPNMPKPQWHAPWKLFRVISGHMGWVRCVAIEPGNEWFATGAADRVIKIWDLASGKLKLSLTGHVSVVRGLAVSPRQPYLFSCGEDRQVKCWDLEYNKVIRHYHGHLSAVYDLSIHPTLDILFSCGRDATCRVWDMRTKTNIHTLGGHTNTVTSVLSQATDPQVITGSNDSTVKLWDLASGRTMATLTNHKKSVRGLVMHPKLNMFASAGPDNIKQWKLPEGKFIQNLSGHNAIVNCLAMNQDNVVVSGADNGTMYFWDWKTGYNFQKFQAPVQPGSLDSEAGIFQMKFDLSGSRLITCEADKTIKIYKEDDTASEETNPINWRPEILKRRRY